MNDNGQRESPAGRRRSARSPLLLPHDPLMQLILGETDAYPDAEERRLFYVALTRARRRAIVVANDGPDSDLLAS